MLCRRRLLIPIMLISVIGAVLQVGCAARPQETFTVVQKKHLTVGSTGSGMPILKKLAEAYMQKHKDVIIDIPAALEAREVEQNTAAGYLEIAFTSQTADRVKYPQLKQYPFARTNVVFAVNPSVPVVNLSSRQIADIFSGRITSWRDVGGPDRSIVVLYRTGGRATKDIIDEYIKGFASAKISAQSVKVEGFQAMNEGIASVTDSIGWTDLGAVKAEGIKVKPLALDGVFPSVENCNSGRYPMRRVMYVMVRGQPTGAVKEFVDFVLSWEGRKIILENGYLLPGLPGTGPEKQD